MKKQKPRKPGTKKRKPQTFTKRKWFPKESRPRHAPIMGAAMGLGMAAEMALFMSRMGKPPGRDVSE